MRVRELLKNEGDGQRAKIQVENEVEDYLIPALDKYREVQRYIFEPFLHSKAGVVGRFKLLVLGKIGNVTRNVVERSFIRQQKFNDNTFTMLINLYNENRELKERILQLEKGSKTDAK